MLAPFVILLNLATLTTIPNVHAQNKMNGGWNQHTLWNFETRNTFQHLQIYDIENIIRDPFSPQHQITFDSKIFFNKSSLSGPIHKSNSLLHACLVSLALVIRIYPLRLFFVSLYFLCCNQPDLLHRNEKNTINLIRNWYLTEKICQMYEFHMKFHWRINEKNVQIRFPTELDVVSRSFAIGWNHPLGSYFKFISISSLFLSLSSCVPRCMNFQCPFLDVRITKVFSCKIFRFEIQQESMCMGEGEIWRKKEKSKAKW